MECDSERWHRQRGCGISIHALTWSATLYCIIVLTGRNGFQSTHSHGVRQGGTAIWRFHNRISIHALTWSATVYNKSFFSSFTSISIHALTWSATSTLFRSHSNYARFQSTHSHGVRLEQSKVRQLGSDFNPRTHMECDSENAVIDTLMISILHIVAKTDVK